MIMSRSSNYEIVEYFLMIVFTTLFFQCQTPDDLNCIVDESHPNGVPKKKVCIIDEDKGMGRVEEYYPDGQLKSVINVIDGKVSGKNRTYYQSGSLKEMVEYYNGQKHGGHFEYDETGNLLNYNYAVNGDVIYIKTPREIDGKIDSSPVFIPLLSYVQNDTFEKGDTFRFEVSLPLPDSHLDGREMFFAYQMKPMKLADSIIIAPSNELDLNNGIELSSGSLVLQETGKQIFYGHIIDKKEKHIFSPYEDTILVISPLREE